MRHNQKLGRWGEEAAAEFLSGRGYRLLAHNVRTPYGEIDLIARREALTVFVEVKARTSRRFGFPEQSIGARKSAHMAAAAEHYAVEHEITDWQIDVISVEGRPGVKPRITHFENVLS